YKDLNILGKNYYITKLNKKIYENKNWNVQGITIDVRPENDIIIGIIKNQKFKLKHKESYDTNDARLKEKGINCIFLSKEENLNLMKKLGITIPSRIRLKHCCLLIYIELVYREIKSRSNN